MSIICLFSYKDEDGHFIDFARYRMAHIPRIGETVVFPDVLHHVFPRTYPGGVTSWLVVGVEHMLSRQPGIENRIDILIVPATYVEPDEGRVNAEA
jgi:hypothetical protein